MQDSRLLDDPVFGPIFERLQGVGVELALDNVRPSSLSIHRLQRLPVSVVNLDRELVRTLVTDPTSRELARLICTYAHARERPVTACQVETAQELDVARLLDVDLVQGNVISRPLRAADLTELLTSPSC
jgi:EAL domain-containing protein (putative c-di-GMP-specific phosphodiesterase class I)